MGWNGGVCGCIRAFCLPAERSRGARAECWDAILGKVGFPFKCVVRHRLQILAIRLQEGFSAGKNASILKVLKWPPDKGLSLADLVLREWACKLKKLAKAEAREARAMF